MIPDWIKRLIPGPVQAPLRKTRDAVRSLSLAFGGGFKTCSVRGLSIDLLVTSEIEHYRADTYASKEPDTLDWLDAELNDEDVFFDIGANIGVYSLYAAALNAGCRVFAFEPEAQNFATYAETSIKTG